MNFLKIIIGTSLKNFVKRYDILYATNIEIVDYLKACDNLQFSMNSEFVYNPSYQSVWISVDGIIIEIPGGKQIYFN